MDDKNILIIAGEVSGDIHVAPVVSAMKEVDPGLRFWGTGGTLMRETGVELLADIDEMAVMGFSDVPRVLPRLSRLKKAILKRILRDSTSLVILVDYPGFNLNLAETIKKLKNPPPILYYISPQVWAWRPGRIGKMKAVIDKLAVIFPFEVDLFKSAGVDVEFVGHPLLDELDTYLNEAPGTDKKSSLLALLPGSRQQEIRRHLSLMIAAAERLREDIPDIEIAIGRAPNLDEDVYRHFIEDKDWIGLHNDTRQLVMSARIAAVCSGTATLETALLGTPQVVVYKTSPVNFLIARRFVKLTRISLVNVVAGKEVVPELIQHNFTTQRLKDELKRLWTDDDSRDRIKQDYEIIRQKLGEPGAAEKVAQMALGMI